MRTLLAPGGVAVISVPAYPWLFGHHDVQLGHHRRYTRGGLCALFERGFAIERSRYYGASLIPVALWFSRIARTGYPVQGASHGLGRSRCRPGRGQRPLVPSRARMARPRLLLSMKANFSRPPRNAAPAV